MENERAMAGEINSDFSALKPEDPPYARVEIHPGDIDLSSIDIEDGIFFSYTVAELDALGDGDRNIGFTRVKRALKLNERTLLEIASNPNRPLQHEFEWHPPTLNDQRIVIFYIEARKTEPDPQDELWELPDLTNILKHPMLT